MRNVNMLVIGNGHLGNHIALKFCSGHYKGELKDLKAVDVAGYDIIVNAAGKTDLKFCEDNPLAAWHSNVEGALHAFRLAKAAGVGFVQISSGCLWDGPYDVNGKPFAPISDVSPASFYAWTKAACDAIMLSESLGSKLMILRPRQIYSAVASPRNTLTKLMTYKKLIDTPNSMTSADTVAKTIDAIAPVMVSPRYFIKKYPKIMNVYDIGIVTPYRVGMMLHEAGLRDAPEMMSKSELDSWHKPRRVDAVLRDEFFESLVQPPNVEQELKRAIDIFAKVQRKDEC